MTHSQNRCVFGTAIVALGLLAYFVFVHLNASGSKSTIAVAKYSETAGTQGSGSAMQVSAIAGSGVSAPTGQKPASKYDLARSRRAYDDLMAAMSRIAHAKSYKRITRTRNADGTSTLHISIYKQSSTGTDLYREDVDVVDSSTGKLLKRISDEFTNDQGTFFIPHQAGSPQTAYLLTNATEPEVSYRQSLISAVSADPSSISDSAMLNYTEGTITAENGALETVVNITTISPSQASGGSNAPESTVSDVQFRIEKATGNITSQAFYDSSGNVLSSADFPTTDINPALADSLFSIPQSLPVVPAANKVEAMQSASSYGQFNQAGNNHNN